MKDVRRSEASKGAQAVYLGRKAYAETWALQKQIHSKVVQGESAEKLILVEHNPVITLGRRASLKNLLLPEEELKKRGLELFRIERGGDVTYHGPGQLVGYPIINLKKRAISVHEYVHKLEESLIRLLRHYGIDAFRRESLTGVWTETGKIAAIGIAVKNWVTFHGFALNVNTDLSYFDLIVPCGLTEPVTSIKKILGRSLELKEVAMRYIEHFESVLCL